MPNYRFSIFIQRIEKCVAKPFVSMIFFLFIYYIHYFSKFAFCHSCYSKKILLNACAIPTQQCNRQHSRQRKEKRKNPNFRFRYWDIKILFIPQNDFTENEKCFRLKQVVARYHHQYVWLLFFFFFFFLLLFIYYPVNIIANRLNNIRIHIRLFKSFYRVSKCKWSRKWVSMCLQSF